MSLFLGKSIGGKMLRFIFAFALLIAFQIRFVLLETNVNNGQAVLLQKLNGAHLFISASPVILFIYSQKK